MIQHRKTRYLPSLSKTITESLFCNFLFKDGYQHLVKGSVIPQRGYGFNSNEPIPKMSDEIRDIVVEMVEHPEKYEITEGII